MRRSFHPAWAVFLLAGLSLFPRLGGMPLIEPDEGRNAEIAREMKESGDWLVPTYDGLTYLDKPALYFAMVAFSYRTWGVNETAARLPSAICGLAVLALLFAFCRREHGPRAAVFSLLVLASTPLFIVFSRSVIFDMPLALCTSVAVLAAFRAEEARGARRRLWHALGAAGAGVGTLIKGPVGFLVPGLVLVAHGLWSAGAPAPKAARAAGPPGADPRDPAAGENAARVLDPEPGFLGRYFAPLNFVVFLAITLPWFLALCHRQPEFLRYGVIEETFRRYSTSAFHRTAPFYYYLPVVLGTFFPWSLLIPGGIVLGWWMRRRLSRPDRLCLLWAVVVVLFFSTSRSKLPGYILAAAVPHAILVGRLFARAADDPHGRCGRMVRGALIVLALASTAAGAVVGINALRPGALQAAFHIHSAEFNRLQPVFLPAAASLLVVALGAAAALRGRGIGPAFAAFLLFPISLLTINYPGLRGYAEASSARALARSVQSRPAATVACLECFPTSLPFYLRRTVVLISRDGHELTSNYLRFRLGERDEWPPSLIRLDELGAWVACADRPATLLGTGKSREILESMAVAEEAPLVQPIPGWWELRLPAPGQETRSR